MNGNEEAGQEVVTPDRPTRKKNPARAHSTARSDRSARRAALLEAMEPGRVGSFAAHVARTRARLSEQLLEQNPDQEAEARLWGDRGGAA